MHALGVQWITKRGEVWQTVLSPVSEICCKVDQCFLKFKGFATSYIIVIASVIYKYDENKLYALFF